jgi:RHS repeat-associated protein
MSTTYRVLSDQLYRSVATVTTSNVVTEAYDTDAYGNTLCYSGPGTDGEWFTDDDVQTNNPINTTIFTGRQYDPESQIYYYRARYYSPEIGRFISRDQLENAELRQGPNLYWYVQDNTVNKLDPSGNQQIFGPLGEPGGSRCCKDKEAAYNNLMNQIQELTQTILAGNSILESAASDVERERAALAITVARIWAICGLAIVERGKSVRSDATCLALFAEEVADREALTKAEQRQNDDFANQDSLIAQRTQLMNQSIQVHHAWSTCLDRNINTAPNCPCQ